MKGKEKKGKEKQGKENKNKRKRFKKESKEEEVEYLPWWQCGCSLADYMHV